MAATKPPRLSTEPQTPNGRAGLRQDRRSNPQLALRLDAAAVHVLAALHRSDNTRARTAIEAMLDEGLTLPEVAAWCDCPLETLHELVSERTAAHGRGRVARVTNNLNEGAAGGHEDDHPRCDR